MSGALPISARTPSRTIKLSSERNTVILGSGMPPYLSLRSQIGQGRQLRGSVFVLNTSSRQAVTRRLPFGAIVRLRCAGFDAVARTGVRALWRQYLLHCPRA